MYLLGFNIQLACVTTETKMLNYENIKHVILYYSVAEH